LEIEGVMVDYMINGSDAWKQLISVKIITTVWYFDKQMIIDKLKKILDKTKYDKLEF
jgi:hypothetical protein